MRHEATLLFPFPSEAARAIVGALAPEAAQAEVPKTRGEIALADGGLEVRIRAADLPSLRASVNSHLRWVDAAAKAAALGRS